MSDCHASCALPLVSTIIPAYQAEAFLAEAIDSVLGQSYRPLELIVVDDGSTDGTCDVISSYQEVRSVRQENRGMSAARNAGIAMARGQLLAFLDADDLWTSERLTRQVELLLGNPELDMVFGQVEQFRHLPPGMETAPLKIAVPMTVPMAGTMVVRIAFFHQVGLFSPAFKLGEFIDWYMRACELGMRSEALPDVVLRRRVHDNNAGIRERAARGDYARVLKAAVDRRRGKKAAQS